MLATSKQYSKRHTLTIDGKPILNISAAKVFKEEYTVSNSEDKLFSTIVSCRVMSYLYVCTQNGIEVLSYTDAAEVTLEV
jgi:organic hydroperoxide reductase OsmC/OhrA